MISSLFLVSIVREAGKYQRGVGVFGWTWPGSGLSFTFTFTFTFTFSHLADAFVQSDVQGREQSS